MTDELKTNADRDPQREGGRVQPGDGHALAEKAKARAREEEGTDDTQSGETSETGQVSSVQNMDLEDADTPISDSQSVAGQPDGESGLTDEGPTGPNSRGGADRN